MSNVITRSVNRSLGWHCLQWAHVPAFAALCCSALISPGAFAQAIQDPIHSGFVNAPNGNNSFGTAVLGSVNLANPFYQHYEFGDQTGRDAISYSAQGATTNSHAYSAASVGLLENQLKILLTASITDPADGFFRADADATTWDLLSFQGNLHGATGIISMTYQSSLLNAQVSPANLAAGSIAEFCIAYVGYSNCSLYNVPYGTNVTTYRMTIPLDVGPVLLAQKFSIHTAVWLQGPVSDLWATASIYSQFGIELPPTIGFSSASGSVYPASAVAEPTPAALLVLGLGAIGAALRRRSDGSATAAQANLPQPPFTGRLLLADA